jgi:hypothetical protein
MCVATTWMLFRVWGPGRVVWGFATGFSLSAIEEDTVPTRHTREPERDSIAHSQVPVWPHVTFKLVRARRAHTHTPDRPEAAGTAGASEREGDYRQIGNRGRRSPPPANP